MLIVLKSICQCISKVAQFCHCLLNFHRDEPRYHLLSHKYCNETRTVIIAILDRKCANDFSLNAREVSLQLELIKHFNSIDAHLIGFLSGMESVLLEAEIIKTLKIIAQKVA